MKLLPYILLIAVFASCSEQTSVSNESKIDTIGSDSATQHTVELTQFSEFTLTTKDTIVEILKYDVISNKLELGTYETDTSSIEVITDFKLIPNLDNGFKGKSELYLIVNINDTFRYEANNRNSLPVDLYKNHFVFINDLNQFVFVVPELIVDGAVCFSYGWDECLTN